MKSDPAILLNNFLENPEENTHSFTHFMSQTPGQREHVFLLIMQEESLDKFFALKSRHRALLQKDFMLTPGRNSIVHWAVQQKKYAFITRLFGCVQWRESLKAQNTMEISPMEMLLQLDQAGEILTVCRLKSFQEGFFRGYRNNYTLADLAVIYNRPEILASLLTIYSSLAKSKICLTRLFQLALQCEDQRQTLGILFKFRQENSLDFSNELWALVSSLDDEVVDQFTQALGERPRPKRTPSPESESVSPMSAVLPDRLASGHSSFEREASLPLLPEVTLSPLSHKDVKLDGFKNAPALVSLPEPLPPAADSASTQLVELHPEDDINLQRAPRCARFFCCSFWGRGPGTASLDHVATNTPP